MPKVKIRLDILHELIHNSVNPIVAFDLIDNKYIAPEIPHKAINSQNEIMTFTSFDRWRDKVYYFIPKYRWYKEDNSDWNSVETEIYKVKVEYGVNRFSMSLFEWELCSKEYEKQMTVISEGDLQIINTSGISDQEMNPSTD